MTRNAAPRIKFTDRTIAALVPPANGRMEYVDTDLDGLRLRASSTGVKTFSLLRRAKNGEPERITIGRFGTSIKTEGARKVALDLNSKIAGGDNPGEARRAQKGELTFDQFFTTVYVKRAAKKKSLTDDRQRYRDYLKDALGKKKLSAITRKDIATIHGTITNTGRAALANRVKALASAVFREAIATEHLDANPAKGIKSNAEVSRGRFLKPHELPRVFAALADEPNESFRHLFVLSLLTGARRANVVAMRWKDLDLDGSVWTIPAAVSKNAETLHIPLVPEAVAILTQRKEAAGKGAVYVFSATTADSKKGYTSGEHKAWLRLLDRDELTQLRDRIEAAGGKLPESAVAVGKALAAARALAAKMKLDTEGARLDDLHIHDLRRSLGSWQARTGASMVIIGKSLGHKSQQATAVYARLDLDPVRQAFETATSAMLEAAGAKPSADVVPLPQSQRKRA